MRFSPLSFSERMAVLCSLVVVLFCTWNAAAQTKEQLGAKYKQIATFEIQPGIVAFSMFSKDGNVCQITIEKPGYVDAQHSDFDSTIPSGEVDGLVDEVVPPSERGKRSKYLKITP
ncbi:MAG TPA: hypothetical protein VMI10_22655 [Terriglobales bacterium]|nr:hypothetical protein [Terriglobales bacterium]